MIRSLTHPDTHPDSSEKHNSNAKFTDEINIHKLSKGGLRGYKIRWWIDGKRKEAYRKSYEDALAFKCDVAEKVLFGSPKAFKKTHLSDSQLVDAEAAFGVLGGRLSALEAAQLALKAWKNKYEGIELHKAYELFLEHIEGENLRPETVTKYRQTTLRFVDYSRGLRTSDIKHDNVNCFMQQFEHPLNFNARRRELKRFLNFIKSNSWLNSDPLDKIKPKKIEHLTPRLLSPEQVRELFSIAKALSPEGSQTYLALLLFAAVRPEEMRRLSVGGTLQECLNLETGYLTIPSRVAKGRGLRKIKIRPALKAFLTAYPHRIGLKEYHFKKIKSQLSFKIPHDGLRHTGITAIYMDLRNFADTALETGNSEQVIRKHYLGNWTEEQSSKFWSIRPI
jgi:hypothetical protein